MIDNNEGGYIIPFFPAVIEGHDLTVHGLVESKLGATFNNGDLEHMWMA